MNSSEDFNLTNFFIINDETGEKTPIDGCINEITVESSTDPVEEPDILSYSGTATVTANFKNNPFREMKDSLRRYFKMIRVGKFYYL